MQPPNAKPEREFLKLGAELERLFNFASNADTNSELINTVYNSMCEHLDPAGSALNTDHFGFHLIRSKELPQYGHGLKTVVDFLTKEFIPKSINTSHPRYLQSLSASTELPAVIGHTFAAMLKPILATKDSAPLASRVEQDVAAWLAQIIGLPENSSGIFLPGGSIANLVALSIARNKALGLSVLENGITQQQRSVVLASEAAHYSITSAVRTLGIGSNNLILVPTNSDGQMDMPALKGILDELEQQQTTVICVVATLGTSAIGAFDPLEEIVSICRPRSVRIHADAAFGGRLSLSSESSYLFDGIEHVDSVIWNAHKTFFVPGACSALLLPNLNELKESFDLRADYLFHDNNAEDDDDYVDLGKHSLVCSKYFDALPLWVILQCYGLDYFRSQIDENVSLTHFVNQYLNTSTDLIAAHKAIAPVVCFRFRPGGFEGQEAPEEREYFNTLHQAVRKKAKELGRAQFGSVKLGGYQHFRIVFANPRINQFDLRELLTELASLCWDYLEEHPPVFVERVEESFKIANQP